MADNLPTVWQAEPHTLAKHEILKGYLKAWFPILSRQSRKVSPGSREILFIDGFAGPGEYEGSQPGSPIIALKAALEHSVDFPIPVRFMFIERYKDRCEHLEQVLCKYSKEINRSANVFVDPPRQGECNQVLAEVLDECERRGVRFGPAFAFLDQFGYSAVSMELIKRILAYPQCEVFSYLDFRAMNRFISHPAKASSFSRTYGGDDWQEAIPLAESQQRKVLLDKYQEALHDRAKAKYVYSFEMLNKHNRLLNWLTFCTNSLRGLEEMKKAMWKVDGTGGCRFSDKDNPQQMRLLKDSYDDAWLAETLAANLADKTMTVQEIHQYVLTNTPCYKFKAALKKLELGKRSLKIVQAPQGRRRGEFAQVEQIVVRFGPPDLF